MTEIFLSGRDRATAEEAAAATRNYTPGYNEDVDETPEPEDNTPVAAEDMQRLAEASRESLQPVLHGHQGDRAAVFVPPGDWVSPVKKQRERQAMTLPSLAQASDLNARIGAVLRFDGAPESVTTLARDARDAIAEARKAHEAAQHPDNRRYAVSTAAKDAVVLAFATATASVGALEDHAASEVVQAQWFANVTEGLADQQQAAAKALDAAAKDYASWRQAITAGEALAVEQGRWGPGWHRHVDDRQVKPLELIGEIRKARDLAHTDDPYLSGQYLVADPTPDGKVPEWTMAALQRSAQIAPGSFAESVFVRLRSPHPADGPANDTLALRDLRIINTEPIPALTPEQKATEGGRASEGVDG